MGIPLSMADVANVLRNLCGWTRGKSSRRPNSRNRAQDDEPEFVADRVEILTPIDRSQRIIGISSGSARLVGFFGHQRWSDGGLIVLRQEGILTIERTVLRRGSRQP